MQRRNTQTLGEVLRDFFEDNTELYEKMMDPGPTCVGRSFRAYDHAVHT